MEDNDLQPQGKYTAEEMSYLNNNLGKNPIRIGEYLLRARVYYGTHLPLPSPNVGSKMRNEKLQEDFYWLFELIPAATLEGMITHEQRWHIEQLLQAYPNEHPTQCNRYSNDHLMLCQVANYLMQLEVTQRKSAATIGGMITALRKRLGL